MIEIPYNEDVNTNLLNDSLIFYYVLLVIDCVIRYKNFIFLTSKSSEEVAEAFKSIYDNFDNSLNWSQKLQCDKDTEFIGYVTLLMNKYDVKIWKIIACFKHANLVMIDSYAELFELRVFKNQYLIEFFLFTDKHCRECK